MSETDIKLCETMKEATKKRGNIEGKEKKKA